MGRKRTVNKDIRTQNLYLRRDGYYYRFPNKKEKKVAGLNERPLALLKWAGYEGVRLDPHAILFKAVAEQFRIEYIPQREAKTQKDYNRQLDNLVKVFGESAFDTVTPVDVAEYRKARTAQLIKKGGKGTQANREMALLSMLWNWAREKGYTKLPNPVTGIKRNKETGRDTYMPDAVFKGIYLAADQSVMDAMDIGKGTGMDIGVILKAKTRTCIIGDLEELAFRRSKTKIPVRYNLRDEDGNLNEFGEKVKAIVQRKRDATGPYLIQDDNGQAIPYDTFCDRFDKARTAAGYAPKEYQFKDIRSKVATDVEDVNYAQDLLAHASSTTTKKHYIKRGKLVEPAN
jgi:integrase